jgi:glyoxylase-like metal-dependent hydrolase (beta-lactamase superfamily II)
VKIHSGGETVLHLGDLLSTYAHVNPGWIPAYDEQPLQSLEQKKHWLGRAAAEGWWLTFSHDAFYLAGRLADSKLTDRIPVEGHGENDQWGSEPSEK